MIYSFQFCRTFHPFPPYRPLPYTPNKRVSPDNEECFEGTPKIFEFPKKLKLTDTQNSDQKETAKEKRFKLVHEAPARTNELI